MAFTWNTLDNKVARRVISTFLVASLLPLYLFALGAYLQVTTELNAEKGREIRDTAKAVGLSTFSQLQWVEDGLRLISRLHGPDAGTRLDHVETDLSDRVERLFRFRRDAIDAESARLGVDAAVLNSLLGQALVSVAAAPGEAAQIYMAVAWPDKPEWMLAAQFNGELLWQRAGLTGRSERICVFDQHRQPILCNQPSSAAWQEAVQVVVAQGNHTMRVTVGDDRPLLAASWGLFLRPHYGVDHWNFVVSVPEQDAYAAIAMFRWMFPVVAFGVLALSLLLAIRLIRSNLHPLELILHAARRLGNGDFTARADVRTDDEFADVGRVLNESARKLGQNFHAMQVIADLDDRLRGSPGLEQAVVDVCNAVHRLADCGAAVVLDEPQGGCRIVVRYARDTDTTRLQCTDADAQSLPTVLERGTLASLGERMHLLQRLAVDPQAQLCLYPAATGEQTAQACIVLIDPPPLGQVQALVTQVSDALGMVIQNHHLNRRLVFQAKHDALTGLLNRIGLKERFDALAMRQRERHQGVVVMILDLDRFKVINDTQGHAAGDALLVEVARRLSEAFSDDPDLIVSRFSGDEFVVVAASDDDHDAIAMLAERVGTAFSRPFDVVGRMVRINASRGVTVSLDAGSRLDILMHEADMAMYEAKATRDGTLHVYDAALSEALRQRMELEQALKGALAAGEFELNYQPVVNATNGRLSGAEALLRWRRADGFVSPAVFIPMAEELGVIDEIGDWVFEAVCRDLQRWNVHEGDLYVSVNLSPAQMEDPHLAGRFAQILEQTGVPPACLVLEITETAVMADSVAVEQMLTRMRELGIRILVDDFGTGHGSFKYLRDLPIDGVKIDRMFVTELPDNPKDAAIVSSLATLARELELRVVVEGVETRPQGEYVLQLGLPIIQGYFYSRPLPVDAFEPLLHGAGEFEPIRRETAADDGSLSRSAAVR